MQKELSQPEAGPGGLEAGGWWGRELSMGGLKTCGTALHGVRLSQDSM